MPTVAEFIEGHDVWPLLPLPLPELVIWKQHKSCRLRQRQKHRLQVRRAAVQVVKVINLLHGGQNLAPLLTAPDQQCGSRMKVTPARALALKHILEKVALEVRARRSLDLTGVRAVASLLKAPLDESGYVRPTGVRQVPMVASRMVEPSETRSIDMLEALPHEDAVYYTHECNVVEMNGKSDVLFKEIETHYGFVGGELSEFLNYLRRDDVRHLWEWDLMLNIKAIAGVSTVLKKNGHDQRKLIMQCAANYMFGDPAERAHLGMGGGSSLARCFLKEDCMEVAACDEDSAFTYVRVPSWMSAWQAAPPMLAADAWDLLDQPLRDKISNPFTTYVDAESLDDDDTVLIPDDEWAVRQEQLRHGEAQGCGWTVEEWCNAVRQTKHGNTRTFVAIHMFGGERRVEDIQFFLEQLCAAHELSLLMLTVDLADDPGWDFTNPRLLHMLLSLAEEGLIDLWLGGPPCSTVARARHVPLPGGPRPLRFRWALWGRHDLRPYERARVQEANTLWLNFLAVAEAVASRGGGYLMEHPADPGRDPYPSIWITDEMCEFERRVNGRRVHLHQCPFGGTCPKLTTLSGNLIGMEEVDGVRCPGVSSTHQHGISIGRAEDGSFHTRKLQTYPPGLCQAMAKMLFLTVHKMYEGNAGPTGSLLLPGETSAPRITAWSTCGTSGGPGIALLNEATARSCSVRLDQNQSAVYVHVDDTVFISTSSSGKLHSDKLLDETVSRLGLVGFQVTQQSRSGSLDKVVGYEVVRKPAQFRLPLKKMALLREALLYLVNQPKVSVDVLRSLLGMWIFGSLLRRELLSIPHAIFHFIDRHAGEVVNWWPTARDEVRAMAHTVSLMSVHVGAPILPWLFATDAMGANDVDWGGYGMAVTQLDECEIDSLLRQGEAVGRTVPRADGGGAKHPCKSLQPTVPFTLLPDAFFGQLTEAVGALEITSLLEKAAPRLHPDLKQRVSSDTLLKYQKAFSAFTDFLQAQLDLDVLSSEDLDNLMMDYRTEMELTRSQHVLLVASAEFFLPHMKGHLHQSREALRGRASAEAIRHTVPLTSECALLFAAWLCAENRPKVGAAMLVQHATGLRPSELLALQTDHVHLPLDSRRAITVRLGANYSTKVKREQYVLVHPESQRLAFELLSWLVSTSKPGERLFPFGYSTYNNAFKQAEQRYQLHLGTTAHSGRSGFATHLVMLGIDRKEIQARGRWLSESSFNTYIDIAGASHIAALIGSQKLATTAAWLNHHIWRYFGLSAPGNDQTSSSSSDRRPARLPVEDVQRHDSRAPRALHNSSAQAVSTRRMEQVGFPVDSLRNTAKGKGKGRGVLRLRGDGSRSIFD
eukprot:Skav222678  [mRNA]  locus=scaffold1471:8076:12526:- [translate_table: standard]